MRGRRGTMSLRISPIFLILASFGCSPTHQVLQIPDDRPGMSKIVWTGKFAVDVSSGKALWEFSTKEPWQGVFSEVDGADLFVETPDRQLQRRRLLDGEVVWSVPGFSPEDYKVSDYFSDSPTITVAGQIILY